MMRAVLPLLSLALVGGSLAPQVSERASVTLVLVALLLGVVTVGIYVVGEYRRQQPAPSAFDLRYAAARDAERASRRRRHQDHAECTASTP